MVAAGCLLILGANFLLFREAQKTSPPLPILKLISVVSLLWMFTGAYGICTRIVWTRSVVLAILYIGSIGFFVTAVIVASSGDGPLVGHLTPVFIATAVYLYVSLVFTHSKHIRRLSSRAWE